MSNAQVLACIIGGGLAIVVFLIFVLALANAGREEDVNRRRMAHKETDETREREGR